MKKRKSYTTPTLRAWGTVADLTGFGGGNHFSGSVDPKDKAKDIVCQYLPWLPGC